MQRPDRSRNYKSTKRVCESAVRCYSDLFPVSAGVMQINLDWLSNFELRLPRFQVPRKAIAAAPSICLPNEVGEISIPCSLKRVHKPRFRNQCLEKGSNTASSLEPRSLPSIIPTC